MSPEPPADPDEIALRVVCGDLRADDPAVLEWMAAHPERAAELAAIRRVQQALDRAAALERSVLREAGVTGPTTARPRLPRWLPPLAAATLALVLWLCWRSADTGSDSRLGPLVVSTLDRLASGALRMQWAGDLAPGEYYRVAVIDPDDGRRIASSPARLYSPEWTSPPITGAMPERVIVEVAVFDAGGQSRSIARSTRPVPR